MLSYLVKRDILRPMYRRIRGKKKLENSSYDAKIPVGKVRAILRKNALGFDEKGNPSWWYSALDGRNSNDDLTHFEFDYIANNISKNSEILVTGCGAGLSTIPLIHQGYINVEGFDYLPNVVASAKEIATICDLKINYWQADGFRPELKKNMIVLLLCIGFTPLGWETTTTLWKKEKIEKLFLSNF
jgi:hypothetical protein